MTWKKIPAKLTPNIHHHFGCPFAWVYYLRIDDDVAATIRGLLCIWIQRVKFTSISHIVNNRQKIGCCCGCFFSRIHAFTFRFVFLLFYRLVCCLSRHFGSPCNVYPILKHACTLHMYLYFFPSSTSVNQPVRSTHTHLCVCVCVRYVNNRANNLSHDTYHFNRVCEWVSECVYLWCIRGENAKAAATENMPCKQKHLHIAIVDHTTNENVWLWCACDVISQHIYW